MTLGYEGKYGNYNKFILEEVDIQTAKNAYLLSDLSRKIISIQEKYAVKYRKSHKKRKEEVVKITGLVLLITSNNIIIAIVIIIVFLFAHAIKMVCFLQAWIVRILCVFVWVFPSHRKGQRWTRYRILPSGTTSSIPS